MEQNYEVGGEVTVRGKITALGGGPFVNDSIQITFGGDIRSGREGSVK